MHIQVHPATQKKQKRKCENQKCTLEGFISDHIKITEKNLAVT
jgi:hypothetical protein